ncbi:MAG: hypothetical protein WCI73_14210 [Phycisphaerae bacterium]
MIHEERLGRADLHLHKFIKDRKLPATVAVTTNLHRALDGMFFTLPQIKTLTDELLAENRECLIDWV